MRARRQRHRFVPVAMGLEERILLTADPADWLVDQLPYVHTDPDSITVTPGMLLNPDIHLPIDAAGVDYTGIKSWTVTYSTALKPIPETSYTAPNNPEGTHGRYQEESPVTITGSTPPIGGAINYTSENVQSAIAYAPKDPGNYTTQVSVVFWCWQEGNGDADNPVFGHYYTKTESTTLNYEVVAPSVTWWKIAGDNLDDPFNPYPGQAPPFGMTYFTSTGEANNDANSPKVGVTFIKPDGTEDRVGYWGYVDNTTPYDMYFGIIQIVEKTYVETQWEQGAEAPEDLFEASDALDKVWNADKYWYQDVGALVYAGMASRLSPVVPYDPANNKYYYNTFAVDVPTFAKDKEDPTRGRLLSLEYRTNFKTYLVIQGGQQAGDSDSLIQGVPIGISLAEWGIGGRVVWDENQMKYVGTGWAGPGNVPMPPNPLTNSTAGWIAQGDNQRHYLEWLDCIENLRIKDRQSDPESENTVVRDTLDENRHDLDGPIYDAHDAALHDLFSSEREGRHPESGDNIPADPVVLPPPSRPNQRTRVNARLLRTPG